VTAPASPGTVEALIEGMRRLKIPTDGPRAELEAFAAGIPGWDASLRPVPVHRTRRRPGDLKHHAVASEAAAAIAEVFASAEPGGLIRERAAMRRAAWREDLGSYWVLALTGRAPDRGYAWGVEWSPRRRAFVGWGRPAAGPGGFGFAVEEQTLALGGDPPLEVHAAPTPQLLRDKFLGRRRRMLDRLTGSGWEASLQNALSEAREAVERLTGPDLWRQALERTRWVDPRDRAQGERRDLYSPALAAYEAAGLRRWARRWGPTPHHGICHCDPPNHQRGDPQVSLYVVLNDGFGGDYDLWDYAPRMKLASAHIRIKRSGPDPDDARGALEAIDAELAKLNEADRELKREADLRYGLPARWRHPRAAPKRPDCRCSRHAPRAGRSRLPRRAASCARGRAERNSIVGLRVRASPPAAGA